MFAVMRRSGGLEALGRMLAVEQPLVARGVEVLLPEITQALRNWLQAAGGGAVGAQALANWLQHMGGGALAAKLITQRSVDDDVARQIIEALFPDHDAAAAMQHRAARQADLALSLIEQLLRLLAVWVCGYIAARCEVAAVEGRDMFAEIQSLLKLTNANTPSPSDQRA